VKFVTLDAYEQAGGTIRRDLFSDGADGVFIEDVTLLETLVAKKLEATNEIEEPNDEQQARSEAINERLDELEDRPEVWPPETLAIAGAVVTLGSDGEADIRYGYVKPEDAPATSARRKGQSRGNAGAKSPLPASLIESLTAHRSAALTAALIERPDIAFAAAVHALALPVFYNGSARDYTAMKITAQAASLHQVEDSPAAGIIATAEEHWGERLPCNPDSLFAWCLAQDTDTLRGLLAFCVARTVNAVLLKTDRADSPRTEHASMLAHALGLDMAAWFTPTAANYFSKVGKTAIINAMREVKGAIAPAWSGMKKTDLATLAERSIAGSRWLPEPLRAPAAVIAEIAEIAA
jgi:ParB family transcriptional regulator, chromosome partitioning protein